MFNAGFYIPTTLSKWICETPPGWDFGSVAPLTREMITARVLKINTDSGISLVAYRGGLLNFIFDGYDTACPKSNNMDELLRSMSEQLKVMNAFVLCLQSASLEAQETRIEAFGVSKKDYLIFHTREHDALAGLGGEAMTRTPLGGGGAALDRWRYDPIPVSKETMESAAKKLDTLAGKNSGSWLDHASLLNRSAAAHQEHDFSASLAYSWPVIEKCVADKLKKHVSDERKERTNQPLGQNAIQSIERINVSQTIGLLRAMGKLEDGLAGDIEKIRKGRNAWIHGLREPQRETVELAIRISSRLLSESVEETFSVATGLNFMSTSLPWDD
jgi:hypothetical protein